MCEFPVSMLSKHSKHYSSDVKVEEQMLLLVSKGERCLIERTR